MLLTIIIVVVVIIIVIITNLPTNPTNNFWQPVAITYIFIAIRELSLITHNIILLLLLLLMILSLFNKSLQVAALVGGCCLMMLLLILLLLILLVLILLLRVLMLSLLILTISWSQSLWWWWWWYNIFGLITCLQWWRPNPLLDQPCQIFGLVWWRIIIIAVIIHLLSYVIMVIVYCLFPNAPAIHFRLYSLVTIINNRLDRFDRLTVVALLTQPVLPLYLLYCFLLAKGVLFLFMLIILLLGEWLIMLIMLSVIGLLF